MSNKKQNKSKIDPNKIKTRDMLMVGLINGLTKAGAFVDRKKNSNKYQARGRYQSEE